MAIREDIRAEVERRIKLYMNGRDIPCAQPNRMMTVTSRIMHLFSEALPDILGPEGTLKVETPERGLQLIVDVMGLYATTINEFTTDPEKRAKLAEEMAAERAVSEKEAEAARAKVASGIGELLGKMFGGHVVAVELVREEPKPAEKPPADAPQTHRWNN